MSCYRKDILEILSLRLLRMGIDLRGCPPEGLAITAKGGDTKYADVLRHLAECARCRELVQVFQSTEVGMSHELARMDDSLGEPTPSMQVGPRVLTLVPASVRSWAEDFLASNHLAPHAVAADAGREKAHDDGQAESAVLSLTTEDGSYRVQIFHQASGSGATAILVGEPAGPSTHEVRLMVGDEEFAFDEERQASLPTFPAERVSLIIR